MLARETRELAWQGHPWRELLRLAWPIAVSMLSYSTMTLVDTLFVGKLGSAALAGVGLGGVAAFTLLVFAMGLLRGVKVLVSQAIGAERHHDVPALMSAGVLLAISLGALATVAGIFVAELLPLFSATEQAGGYAVTYLRIRILGAPALLIYVALRETRYGVGDSRSPMVASVVANVVNAVLTYLLIFGLDMGVAGAAWASVAAVGTEALVIIALAGGLGLSRWRRGLERVAAVWRIGLPTGLQFLIELGSFTTLTVLISKYSQVDMAAHQIALHAIHFSFLPAIAAGEAASVMAGQLVGARQEDRVMGIAGRAMILATAYTALCSLVIALFAPVLAGWFPVEPEVQVLTVSLLYVAAVFQIADGANIIARSVLRGTGDVRYPAVVGVVTAWVLTPPLTYLLGFQLGLGALGGWIGLCAEIMIGAGLFWRRLVKGRWKVVARATREELVEG